MERILIEGVVEHGRRLGRELGFPTANLAVPEDVAAADGVYRSRAEVGGKVYDAMSNLGRNPSVGGVERRLETHIFDFRGELTAVGCGSNCSKRSATNAGSLRWRNCAGRLPGTRNIF